MVSKLCIIYKFLKNLFKSFSLYTKYSLSQYLIIMVTLFNLKISKT